MNILIFIGIISIFIVKYGNSSTTAKRIITIFEPILEKFKITHFTKVCYLKLYYA